MCAAGVDGVPVGRPRDEEHLRVITTERVNQPVGERVVVVSAGWLDVGVVLV
jgi:hypothetical protein